MDINIINQADCNKADRSKRIIAIIPARSGSKGIQNKNIKLVCGHPLLYYQIQAAKNTKIIKKIVVSTDSENYANIARLLGAEVCLRPKEIADDKSKSEETLLHTLDHYENKGEKYDILVFLQTTAPLNKAEYIMGCLDLIDQGYDSSVCVTEDYGFFIDDKDIFERPMRQNKKKRLRETGNCWVIKTEALKKGKNRLYGRIGYYVIPRIAALDIDTKEDLALAEAILKKEVNLSEGKYFKTRTAALTEYEENYWGEVIDPDGLKRRLIDEREKKIEDCKKEIEYINKLTPGKILDIGCGCGFLLSAVNNRWGKHGTEISKFAGEQARKYGKIFIGELKDAGYISEYFDVVVMYHVIEHMKDPLGNIEISNELLKHNGKLIISTPNFDSGCARLFGENYRLLFDKTHINLFSDFSLKEFLEDYGFQVDIIDYPYFETRYFNKNNLDRLFDSSKISPPFYGNIMTMYCTKK